MTVTRNIIRDLLPLYAADEASADSKLLIETWIKSDVELASELTALRDERPSSLMTERPRGDQLHSVITQTRSLLRRRTIFLAGALTFTGLPLLAFAYRLEGVHFPLERVPAVEAVCIVAAAVFWTMLVMTMRRMRVAGL